MTIQGIICGPRLYEYEYNGKVWLFEEYASSGPWPLRKDGELRKRAGKVFYAMYTEFNSLSPEEKREYRVGGGCVPF